MLFLPTFLLFLGGLLLTPAPRLVADIFDTYTSAFWIAYVARPAPTAPAPITSLSLYTPFVLAPLPPPPPPQPAEPPFLAPAPVPLAFAHIALCGTAPGHISSAHELPGLDAEAGKILSAVALCMAATLLPALLGAASAASPSVGGEPVAVPNCEVPEVFVIAQQSAAKEMIDLIYSSNKTSPISSPVDPERALEDLIVDSVPTTDNTDAYIPATLLDTVWFHGLTDAADDDVDDELFVYPDSDSAVEDDYVPGMNADNELFVYLGSDLAAKDNYAPGFLAGVDEVTSTMQPDNEQRDDTADASTSAFADNAHGPGLEASIHAPGNKASLFADQSARSALSNADHGSNASVPASAPAYAPKPTVALTQEATLPASPPPPHPSSPARPKEPTHGAALAALAHAYMPSCPQTSIWDQSARTSTPCTSPTTPSPSPPRAKTRRSRRKGKGARDAAASPRPEPAEPAIPARGRVMEDLESRPKAPRRRSGARSLSPSPTFARSAPRTPVAELALPAGLYEREWGLDR